MLYLDQDAVEGAETALFGDGWQSALARVLLVDSRVVRNWKAGATRGSGASTTAILWLPHAKIRADRLEG